MKSRLMLVSSAIIASLICLPAQAQPGPGMGGQGMGMQQGGPGMGGSTTTARGPRDCTQAPDPEACAAHRAARIEAAEACKGKAGPERKQCMLEQRRNFDCNKSANPKQCEARKLSYNACQNQQGPAFRQCVQQKMPPADCAVAKDMQRCEAHQKAREACKDKTGPDHKSCLREQFGSK